MDFLPNDSAAQTEHFYKHLSPSQTSQRLSYLRSETANINNQRQIVSELR